MMHFLSRTTSSAQEPYCGTSKAGTNLSSYAEFKHSRRLFPDSEGISFSSTALYLMKAPGAIKHHNRLHLIGFTTLGV